MNLDGPWTWTSFFSTPKKNRPTVWVGLDNYQAMMADPVFWQSLKTNLFVRSFMRAAIR